MSKPLKKDDIMLNDITLVLPRRKTPDITLHQIPKNRLKTKKGRIISLNAKKILAPALLTIGVLLSTINSKMDTKNIEAKNIPIATKIEHLNEYESWTPPSILAKISEPVLVNSMIQEKNVEVDFHNELWMKKINETDKILGEKINYYADRYGVPRNLAKALMTQERASNDFQNVGRLTKSLCDTAFEVPISFKNSKDIEENTYVDKFYVMDQTPRKESFLTYQEYKNALLKYQNQLEKSKKLAENGYQIYIYDEIIKNTENNIKISLAYLAFNVYQCDMNVHKGLRAYNCGASVTKDATDEMLVNGKIELGDPFYNQHVFAYLRKEELKTLEWKLHDPSVELTNPQFISIYMQFNNIKELENENNKKENGHYL